MRLLVAALLLAPMAASAQVLDAVGACPGPVDISVTGLTPGGDVALLFGLGAGSDVLPAGPCAGLATGLSGVRLARRVTGGSGSIAFTPTVPDGACDKSFQVLDIATCSLSNVETFGGVVDPPDGCNGGATMTSVAPGGDMVLCDDPADVTCEENFGTLCPTDWHLCSAAEYNNRNEGWAEPVPATKALGTIQCRDSGGAGHFSVSYDGIVSLGEDESNNCGYGSSLPVCSSGFGCNEQTSVALCCAPSATCGNGVVDSPEELCDDGNADETDDCFSNCTWRVPSLMGAGGAGC